MKINIILRKFRTLTNIIKYAILEKTFIGKLKYLYFDKGCQDLMICFAALPPREKPLYNFVKGFDKLPLDRLYIGDYWGYRGSYYLYENGSTHPYKQTCELIDFILSKKNYRNVYTAGTSKGGTAALIFGMKYNVKCIFTGACQYHIGSFVNIPVHEKIFKGMMGLYAGEKEEAFLNNYISNMIDIVNFHGKIHLLYSKLEHTYPEHIKFLIDKLNVKNINVVEVEKSFKNHGDVGNYFIPYVLNYFK